MKNLEPPRHQGTKTLPDPDESRGPLGRVSVRDRDGYRLSPAWGGGFLGALVSWWFKPLGAALLILAIALPLTACGKRAAPDPPPGTKGQFPKVYPKPDEQ